MIIKSLLFVILLIFIYETFQNFNKLREEYFVSLTPNNPELNDISKTIAINCKNPKYLNNEGVSQIFEPIEANNKNNDDGIYNLEYSEFKPLIYNPKRKYFYKADILIPEGYRRYKDDENEISNIEKLYNLETDPNHKQILQDEIDIHKWRKNPKNIGKITNIDTNEPRMMRDIITDYYPFEIGMQRLWKEQHSHIPDYTQQLNNGYSIIKNTVSGNNKHIQNKLNALKKSLCNISA
jgi:hypothetical protein